MNAMTNVDWKAVGAVAGPALALFSLIWQATEKLKRPILAHLGLRFVPYDQPLDRKWIALTATARVINPRPQPIIVKEVVLQTTEREPWRPWRRVSLATSTVVHQIQAAQTEQLPVTVRPYIRVRTIRVVVRFRGPRKALRSSWTRDAGLDNELVKHIIDASAAYTLGHGD
jgi:hypothetical protein